MATAQNQPQIQTSEGVANQAVTSVAINLQQAGHNVTSEMVTPVTAQTPVPKSPEMGQIGAEVIGEDLSHIIGTTFGDATTGMSRIRMTKSNRFLGKFLEKLRVKKKPSEQIVEDKAT